MAVTMTSALFKMDNKVEEINTSDVNLDNYNKKYKGHLYCTTENCNAKLVFVQRMGKPNYFKTWPKEDHDEDCLHYFDRLTGRVGTNTEHFINLQIPPERIKRGLKEAYKLSKITKEEKEQIKEVVKPRKKNKKTNGKKSNTGINVVFNKDEADETAETMATRGPNLLKRSVDMLKESDFGKPRIVTGIIENITYSEESALIKIYNDDSKVDVKFEEAFFANSPNYKGLFHHIERFITDNGSVMFVGYGQSNKNMDGIIEFYVYHGDEFTIEDMTLLSLASFYSH
ncbi:hypothetical protein M670_04521 [Schinkia azotoformans MEV2011]|uniref:Uncharacterized protein n=1 Tax=Schinkia azotoformans MEV2011 TaxID=1348973 RepID=A0A072NEZ7_SCHAZ|nr:hypothetical protein [Schinkia azotoformans]KEF36284.1 hypothetical protein M670_04521 [Schinkia azotoformans MEV2011]MEC1697868.1 hypothetical protein [Schinkia azotoformans]MEC1723147.1 hypothetical protein [Schinkia azotoformans]MEC1771879.1 hypothetical protein [Schinkia azotoformans]MEC1780269.1 hypothetical protein [Schinkia azotoformans]